MASVLLTKKFGALRAADDEAADWLKSIEEGQTIRAEATVPSARSLQQHRKFFALLSVVADAMGWNKDQTLGWCKLATGHCDILKEPSRSDGPEHNRYTTLPRSISFAKMTQAEFQAFFDAAIDAVLDRLLPEGTARDELLDEINGRLT